MLQSQPTSRRVAPPPPMVDSENPRVRRARRGDLWYFETTQVPRPDDVCARFVRRIDPVWGFVVYGMLYLFVSAVAFSLGMLPGVLVGVAVGAKGATWVDVLAATGGCAAFALSWWAFASWVKRRRVAARPLIRDGELLEGTVLDKYAGTVGDVAKRVVVDAAVGRVGVKFYRVELVHAGARRMLHVPVTGYTRPGPGAKLTVLFHPEAAHALVFDHTNTAQVARVR